MAYDYESNNLKTAFLEFKDAWDSYTSSDTTTGELLREKYVQEDKEMFDYAEGNQAYHDVHKRWHPVYRQNSRDKEYFDTFMIDLKGNVIYSTFKESDFATNIKNGQWRDSGLADAFKKTLEDNHHVAHIDWAPYGPLGGANAAFLSIGIMNASNNDQILGVYATM